MDRIAELRQKLENVGSLSLAELTELDALLVAAFDDVRKGELEGVEKNDIAVLSEIKEATQTVRAAGQKLKETEATQEAEIAELEKAVKAGVETPAEEPKADEGDTPKEDDAKPGEGEEEPKPAEEVTPPVQEPPVENKDKEIEVPEAKPVLPALAASIDGHRNTQPAQPRKAEPKMFDVNGNEVTFDTVAKNMKDRRDRFPASTAKDVEEQITMATFSMDIPEDRRLSVNDSDAVIAEKINAVTAAAIDPASWPEALTASGGFCAPLATTYDIETIAGAHRPVRDGFARFGADRGGLRFRSGISLAQATALGSTGQWTNATDITPGGNVKATGTIACDPIQEVNLYAVYRQLKFGNLRARADAEGIAAWTKVVGAAWASQGETLLLNAMSTASTAVTTDAHGLGFARDFLHQLRRAAATYRSRNRMESDAMLRVVIPQWLPDAIATDWMESAAAQNEWTSLTSQDVLDQIRAINVNVTLYSDTRTGGNQVYGTQGAHDLLGWKATAEWYLFHEGAFLFLDGGTLDLGLVRDSTLNNTNDVKLFAENFEGLAFVGVESLKVTSSVAVNGTAAAGIDNHAQAIS